MSTIQAIETRYKGYRFRSRLEARWAVFFDAMGLKWEYEPEGFMLPPDGDHYLPDFRVLTPQGKPIWYEVKPNQESRDWKHDGLMQMFYEAGEVVRGSELIGDPVDFLSWPAQICARCGWIWKPETMHDLRIEHGAVVEYVVRGEEDSFGGCHPCDTETPSRADGESRDGLVRYTPHKGALFVKSTHCKRLCETAMTAARRARSARFEHGECG